MENYVAVQLRQFLLSIALGACVACVYDILRTARLLDRHDKLLTHLLDGVFVAALLFGALFLSLSLGQGELRLFMLCGSVLGGLLWFALLSPLLRPIWELWCAALVGAFLLLVRPLVFLWKFVCTCAANIKKGFSFLSSWVTMKRTSTEEEDEAVAKKSTKTKKKKKTSPLLVMVLAVLIVVLAVQVFNVYSDLADARQQEASLSDALSQQQQENDALRADLAKKDDENFIKSLARELLGLAEEGERIFYDVNE